VPASSVEGTHQTVKIDLYALKPASLRLVRPLEDTCIRAGVSADALTGLAVVVSVAGGVAIALSPALPWLLLFVPLAAAARLVCNLLDGGVARRTGTSSPRGELFNEIGDRVSDVAFLVAPLAVDGVPAGLVVAAVVAALLSSVVGIAARAAGGPRLYGGILSKPGRMAVVAIAAVVALVGGDPAGTWSVALTVLAAGAGLTVLMRFREALRVLPGPRTGPR
jgi:CDP-diacylglycerol--glycerol-3-phosphate 3-phosphatidyltransferase